MNAEIDITNVRLTSARLTLRPWRERDLSDFYEYAKVDGVGQMAGWKPHGNIEESKAILSTFIKGKNCFALEYHGKVIGSLGIEKYDEGNHPEFHDLRGREIGYVLSKEYWGQGLMTEAVQAVIAYLFERVQLDFILVGHFDWNRQSKRVVEKCSFTYLKTVEYKTFLGTVEKAMTYVLCRPNSETEKRSLWEGEFPKDDASLVQEIYRRFDESSRLTQSKAAQVEFLTTVKYIERYLKRGDRILDVGAGAGEYSLYFARKGFDVSALELADSNVAAFREKLTDGLSVDLVQGNALDLSRYESHAFDVVLLCGPLYHLHSDQDKLRCIQEAKRVCKKGGKIFFAFISNDIVVLTMQQEHSEYLLTGAYDKDTFRLDDFPFVFHTVGRCRELLSQGGIRICHEIATDGLSELLKDMINGMDEATYRQYLRYHFYVCEKPECLGMSNHLLFIGEATDE